MKNTKISWSNHTWNPVTGCTKVSPGCDHCYAEVIAERFRGGSAWPIGFEVQLRPDRIRQPIGWRKPALIFVNSMSDLFHRDIPDHYLSQIWQTMLAANQHQYQVLTKRPHRMAHKIRELRLQVAPHIWLGVSVENHEMAESRIPELLSVEGPGVRFISAEPLLATVDLSKWLPRPGSIGQKLDWVIVGGESGPNRRPMELGDARILRNQCRAAGVPFFFKQGNALRPGQDDVLDGVRHQEIPMPSTPEAPPSTVHPEQGALL